DGTEYEVDVLIYGTGFQADRFLSPMEFVGEGGKTLEEVWSDGPRAFKGITVPGFPNLFMLYGPNTNIVVGSSIIFFSECEMRYIMGCLKLLLEEGHNAMQPREDVYRAYNAFIDAGNKETAWGAPYVRSWYKNADGRVTQNWPGTHLGFWEITQAPDPDNFEFL
ncbi:MAG: NAD(P)/FAD-dependent oxidoreductase, partial [Alphaproteobacteria bacterium]|nr:NAD(P)/FAD-dependent oxidoreductase [Alphaproteobacteria bacterium]